MDERLLIQNADITTTAQQAIGGNILVEAQNILMKEDGDIRTNVTSGRGGGGNIVLRADSILAFGDSDILAFSPEGSGGDITLDTPAFFGQGFQEASIGANPEILDGNGSVDVNATGSIASGVLSLPDVSFVEGSLTELSDNFVDSEALVANSCIARSDAASTLVLVGRDRLPQSPGEALSNSYSVGEVQAVPTAPTAITEPQAVYQLADGRLVMSRGCEGVSDRD